MIFHGDTTLLSTSGSIVNDTVSGSTSYTQRRQFVVLAPPGSAVSVTVTRLAPTMTFSVNLYDGVALFDRVLFTASMPTSTASATLTGTLSRGYGLLTVYSTDSGQCGALSACCCTVARCLLWSCKVSRVLPDVTLLPCRRQRQCGV